MSGRFENVLCQATLRLVKKSHRPEDMLKEILGESMGRSLREREGETLHTECKQREKSVITHRRLEHLPAKPTVSALFSIE